MISNEEIAQTYGNYMLSIKSRYFAAATISAAGLDARYIVEESIALQIRMIIEGLYMSSLCANSNKFAETWSGYRKERKVGEIKKRLGTSNWWPVPIVHDGEATLPLQQQDFPEPFANSVLGACGDIIHHRPMFVGGTLPNPDKLNKMFDLFEKATAGMQQQLSHHMIEIAVDGDSATLLECEMRFHDPKAGVLVQLVQATKES